MPDIDNRDDAKQALIAAGAAHGIAERAVNCVARAIQTHNFHGTPNVGPMVGLSWEQATQSSEPDLTSIVNFGAGCMDAWRAAFNTPTEPPRKRGRQPAPCGEREREILRLRSEGWTLEAIADRFWLSRERVRQIAKRAAVCCG